VSAQSSDPFHLISTPVAMLPGLGLRVKAGLCGEDPSGKRHRGRAFKVWLSVHAPDGRRVARREAGRLAPGERRFLDLNEATAEFGFEHAHLVVVHRVPEGPISGGAHDFDMFRTVVQYERPGLGSGSVIYETPHGFNSNPGRGSFLSFTNQAVIGPKATTLLALIHYSVRESYAQRAKRRVLLYEPDGTLCAVDEGELDAFTVGTIDLSRLAPSPERLRQLSLVVCSPDASMIPLFINLDAVLGGVSVEHTHPPFSYLGFAAPEAARVRREAIAHYMAAAA
jgi:hypothetical protein